MTNLNMTFFTKTFCLFLLLCVASFSTAQTVFINEIHYDNGIPATDANEGVEIFGPAGTDLTGWSLLAYNGGDGTVYNTINLTGTIDDEGTGFGALWFPILGLQNGAPDGIALIDASNAVVQFLSYEGSFAATNGAANGQTSVDIGVAEGSTTTDMQSLQLIGSGTQYSDFSWVANATFSNGSINTNQNTVPTLSIADITVNESAGTATLTVTLSAAAASNVTFDFVTTDGTAMAPSDYTAISTTQGTIIVGATTATITVSIIDDTDVEGNENFALNLSNPTGAVIANASASITIEDNDTPALPTLSIADISVDEAAGTATLTVVLSAVSASAVTFDYLTTDGTAIAPSDYTAIATTQGTIAAGATSTTIVVSIIDDTDAEGSENFTVDLTNASGATFTNAQATVTINASDTPSGITALGTCAGISSANENNFNITISGLDPTATYDIEIDGTLVFDNVTGAASFTTTTPYAFTDGTASILVRVDAGADGSFELSYDVHEVLCTDADDDGDLDFASGCDVDLGQANQGYIVATAAPYVGTNTYVYVLTNTSDIALQANFSGLFTQLASGNNGLTTDYNVVAFNFSSPTEAAAFIASLTFGTSSITASSSTAGCSMACGSMAYDIECFTCPEITALAVTSPVCSGANITDLTATIADFFNTENQVADFDVEFVYSTTPLTTAAQVYGMGTSIGTVDITAAGITSAMLSSFSLPTNTGTTPITYYLYARIDEESLIPSLTCRPYAGTSIIVNPLPTATVAATTTPICAGEDAVFTVTGTPGAVVDFDINGTPGVPVTLDASGNATVTIVAAMVNQTITLNSISLASTGCGQNLTATETIVVNPIATVDAGADLEICSNMAATLNPIFGGSATSGTWTTSGTGTFNGNMYTPSAADITAGSVILTYTTNDPTGPCPAVSDDLILTINNVTCAQFPWNGTN